MKRFIIGAALVGSLLAGSVAIATPASGDHDAIEDHCPDHQGNPDKDESGSDDNNLVPVAGTRICVKAGNDNSSPPGGATGIVIADGTKTLRQYLAAAGIVDGGGVLGRNVSYWVTYPPLPVLEAFICVNGEIVVLTNEVQATLNLAVAAYLALHPGSVQVESRAANCVATTTTTIAPTTTTTAPVVTTTTTQAPVTTTTVPPVVTTTAPPGPGPAPVAIPLPEAPHDVCIVNGAQVKVAPGTCPPNTLPRTGAGSWLLWVGLAVLVSGLASWGMGTYLRRQAAGNMDDNITL